MSTQPFGQPPAFGAGPAGPPEPAPVEVPVKSSRTAVVAVAAGVVALGVLGGAAYLVLGADDDTADVAVPAGTAPVVEPSAAPSTPPAPLPTAAIRARNVFLPLVDPEAIAASAAAEAEAEAEAAASTPAATPSASPTASVTPVTLVPLPVATSAPVPAVTRTVEVPGPVVTETVRPPTETTTVTPPPADPFRDYVSVVAVDPDPDDDPATELSAAEFVVNGETVVVEEGDFFLDFFQYLGYDETDPPENGPTVRFMYGSALYSVPVGREIGLGEN